jgi:predicted  nucleic acid-binding Zn-ribbon protein
MGSPLPAAILKGAPMADNVESIVPKLLAEIRDGIRDGFTKMDSRLENMDSRLENMDSRLENIDSKLTRIDKNTRESRDQLGRLVGILSHDLADQLADLRRRLTTIEDRLDTR